MCYTETKGKPPENGNSVGGKNMDSAIIAQKERKINGYYQN